MKKVLIASVSLSALMAGSAMAADLSVRAPIMKAPLKPAFSWTGCYLDAGGGYGLWKQDHNVSTGFIVGAVPTPNIPTIEITNGGGGALGRFGAGCDYQVSGTFVIGAFGDFDVMDLTGSLSAQTVNGAGQPVSGDEKESSAWAVGGRIGYLITPTVLSYVNGGWTETRFDQINLTGVLGTPTGNAYPAHTYSGGFLGGGFEYQFNWLPIPGLFLRTEYRYATYARDDLTEFNIATGAPAGNVGLGNVLHSKKQVQTYTTSLVWRFSGFH